MLTRLKVNGFKNLVDVDVRFGPFTCIAGGNGVGKSNLFDAIRFLSLLADKKIVDAVLEMRGADGYDARDLFTRLGDYQTDTMSFHVEMIVPKEGKDDLGKPFVSPITTLRYELIIGFNQDNKYAHNAGLYIIHESLLPILSDSFETVFRFPYQENWSESTFFSTRDMEEEFQRQWISTSETDSEKNFFIGYSSLQYSVPKTLLSAVGVFMYPIPLAARREMQSWRTLHFEPSAMREPDKLLTPPGLGDRGERIAATLYDIARQRVAKTGEESEEARVRSEVAHRLSQLVGGGIREVSVIPDQDGRLRLSITFTDDTVQPARSLSDGTLRFLALAVLEQTWDAPGVYCIEEPENGIHPQTIPVLIRLLQGIATDTSEPVDEYNALRQVIISTHSPYVVQQVPDDSLLVARTVHLKKDGNWVIVPQFHSLPDTWRGEPEKQAVSSGELTSFLGPPLPDSDEDGSLPRVTRVIDREKIRQLAHNLHPNGDKG